VSILHHNSDIEPKNCPKCGGDFIISDMESFQGKEVGFVECCGFTKDYDNDCSEIIRAPTEEEAIEKWNRIPRKVK